MHTGPANTVGIPTAFATHDSPELSPWESQSSPDCAQAAALETQREGGGGGGKVGFRKVSRGRDWERRNDVRLKMGWTGGKRRKVRWKKREAGASFKRKYLYKVVRREGVGGGGERSSAEDCLVIVLGDATCYFITRYALINLSFARAHTHSQVIDSQLKVFCMVLCPMRITH